MIFFCHSIDIDTFVSYKIYKKTKISKNGNKFIFSLIVNKNKINGFKIVINWLNLKLLFWTIWKSKFNQLSK